MRPDPSAAPSGAEEEHDPKCDFRRSRGILHCSCGLPGAAAAAPPHGQGGKGAALQDAEERAGQILEHLHLGAQSERFLMATELGMLMWKRERHAARKALEDFAKELRSVTHYDAAALAEARAAEIDGETIDYGA